MPDDRDNWPPVSEDELVRDGFLPPPTLPTLAPDARERLARHLWIADAGGAKLWDSRAVDRTAWLDRADVLLAVIVGKEG